MIARLHHSSILVLSALLVAGCGSGTSQQTAEGPRSDVEAKPADPAPNTADSPDERTPLPGWSQQEIKSDDGAVAHVQLPDATEFYDVGWTDRRVELVMDIAGNHVRVWELEAPIDDSFEQVIKQDLEWETGSVASDERTDSSRLVIYKTGEDKLVALRLHRSFVCRSEGADDPAVVEIGAQICARIKVDKP